MTRKEIIDFTGFGFRKVTAAIGRAIKTRTSIKLKCPEGKISKNTDFNEEETRLIFQELKATKLQKLLLEEHFELLRSQDYYTIDGTVDFIRQWNKNPTKKCCNTCKYLSGSKINSKQSQPYCSYYNALLTKVGAKVYRDYCENYEYNELERPIIWLNDNAPTNLDKFGDPITNSTNLPKYKKEANDDYIGLVGFF